MAGAPDFYQLFAESKGVPPGWKWHGWSTADDEVPEGMLQCGWLGERGEFLKLFDEHSRDALPVFVHEAPVLVHAPREHTVLARYYPVVSVRPPLNANGLHPDAEKVLSGPYATHEDALTALCAALLEDRRGPQVYPYTCGRVAMRYVRVRTA